jgi:hypothetical protein
MAPRSRPSLVISILASIALAVVAVLLYLGRRDAGAPAAPPPSVGLKVHATDLRTVPDVSTMKRKTTADDLAGVLRKVYTRAFTGPLDATPSTSPSPSPARRIRDLLTPPAVAALKKSPDVFDLGPLVVTNGKLAFGGVVTFDGKDPVGALLDVNFVARATPIASTTPVAQIHQEGTISLRHTSEGWLVDGFDLRIDSRPEPTPSPVV